MQKIYLYKNPQNITREQLEQELLPALPEWRREQALKFKFLLGQVLCAKAFLMLKEGLKQDFNIIEPFTFGYLEYGKPILKEHPNIHFNLSHCNKGILCVIDDEGPVGCDVEVIERVVSEALLKKCCSPREIDFVKKSKTPEQEFIRLWTKKEAVLKFTGEGIHDQLPELLLQERMAEMELKTVICECEGFAYTVCCGK